MSTHASTVLHRSQAHESGALHANGQARYVADIDVDGALHVRPVLSTHAHARVVSIDAAAALDVPGVVAVLTARDIPGHNDISPVAGDEPLLAEHEVHCVGQYVALVVAHSERAAYLGACAVAVALEPLPAVTSLHEAIAREQVLCGPFALARGDVEAALANSPHRLQGRVETGGQDHFYLEGQAAVAWPEENDTVRVASSTQHPSEVQAKVAEVLGWSSNRVVVECPRMGGGFGGKETQAAAPAAMAALVAVRFGKPAKVRFDRDLDMVATGKRHPWRSTFEVGFDGDGRLLGLKVHTFSDGGWSMDLSKPVLQRCLFHLDNAYFIPSLRFEGTAMRTNLASNTAFRGFGGPQGVVTIEHVLSCVAEHLGLDPALVRRRNLYHDAPRDITPYGQRVDDSRLVRIFDELMGSSEYGARRLAIEAANEQSQWVKRGIGFAPVKFGISFTNAMLNQAGALVLVYQDGSVQLNHGGTEMGQGLHTKMLAVCAHELGVPPKAIRMMTTATDKVPNTSATAASSGSDLNGMAIVDACCTLKTRLKPVATALLEADPQAELLWHDGVVSLADDKSCQVPFAKVVSAAYVQQISLCATGYYRTPNLSFDEQRGQGKPFHYIACGGAVIEVEVQTLTGEHCVRRIDVLHDCGNSLVPSIDRGQIEGGLVQGLGWLTSEELVFADGRLLTHGPSTYKIPAVGDVPADFRVNLLERAAQPNVVGGSKAVGEPPFMLAVAVVTALRHAIAACGPQPFELALPATPEAILRAMYAAKGHAIG